MSAAEVVCLGLATMDTIVSMPSWPDPDGRMVADALVRAGGGPAGTAAVTLARLGRRVAMLGAVGDDEAGAAVRSDLEAEGVEVDGIRVRSGRTPESVIILDRSRGTRSILHAPGVAPSDVVIPVDARWVHVDHAGYGSVAAIERDRLSVDAGNPIDGLMLEGLALYAPTAQAIRARYRDRGLGMAIRAALDEGARRVAVTMGADGALAADASGSWHVPGMSVEVVSTLGAGDVFHGALLAMLLDGRPLGDAVRYANVAAALSCRGLDGRSAIPRLPELEAAVAGSPGVEPVLLEVIT
jgi:sulfofructose kinase